MSRLFKRSKSNPESSDLIIHAAPLLNTSMPSHHPSVKLSQPSQPPNLVESNNGSLGIGSSRVSSGSIDTIDTIETASTAATVHEKDPRSSDPDLFIVPGSSLASTHSHKKLSSSHRSKRKQSMCVSSHQSFRSDRSCQVDLVLCNSAQLR